MNIEIYKYDDYRDIIVILIQGEQVLQKHLTRQSIAETLRIQKSYFSRVLHKRAHLNTDQLFAFCTFFKLGEKEQEYLFLLLEYNRTALSSRRQYLLKKIKDFQYDMLQTEVNIVKDRAELSVEEKARYYLNPLNQLVHMALSIERYRQNSKLLATILDISEEQITDVLLTLKDLGLITIDQQATVVIKKRKLHLNRNSIYFWPWRLAFQNHLLRKSQMVKDKSYNFGVVFSADEQTYLSIRTKFLKFLKEIEREVEQAPANDLYQMSFDILQWGQ